MERNLHEFFMQRCLQLARLGESNVAPNPVVGAVLVHEGQIIGEGYHHYWGGPHAEVNCINSVPPELQELIPRSVLYVSLEPCAHHGKTPPCADLVVSQNIPEVVIGCVDLFSKVAGKGIEKLRQAGIAVTVGVLEDECRHLNRRFFTSTNSNGLRGPQMGAVGRRLHRPRHARARPDLKLVCGPPRAPLENGGGRHHGRHANCFAG